MYFSSPAKTRVTRPAYIRVPIAPGGYGKQHAAPECYPFSQSDFAPKPFDLLDF
jgi:hypothetical protein